MIQNKQTHSFNINSGCLEVDYEKWISKQDIIFNQPIQEAWDASIVGNGKVGAAVWNAEGLNLEVTAVDASPHTCYSSGLITLKTEPSLLDCENFHQRMNLYDATVTTEFGSLVKTTVFGVHNSEMLGILVEDNRENVSEVTVRVGIWDITETVQKDLYNDSDDFDEWKKMEWVKEDSYPVFTRGETTYYGFGYGFGATVQGTDFSVVKIDDYNYELKVKPAKKYTIWIANPCKLNANNKPLLDVVKDLFNQVNNQGYENVFAEHKSFWNEFWQKSFVQFTDITESGEYIENSWYNSIYFLSLASRATYPGHFISGIFRWAGDSNMRWCAYYTYFNQRAINNHWLTSNHDDMIKPYLNYLVKIVPHLLSETRKICGIDGLKMPEGCDFKGDRMYDTGNNYTGRIYTDALEGSLLMYQYSKYTNNDEYLKDVCYPYFREAIRFYTNRLKYDGRFYNIEDSNSLEMFWDVKNPITDLTIIRVMFPLFIELSERFSEDKELAEKAFDILKNIAPLETGVEDGNLYYLPCASPVPEQKNIQNPEMEIFFPYGYIGIDSPDYELGVKTWLHRKLYYTIWSPDAVAAARLGLGDIAYDGIVKMCLNHQTHANGFHDDNNGCLESNGLIATGINEMLLQSYNGLIRVFPAIPQDKNFVSKFTLRAMGGFIVSSEYENEEVKYIGIKSLFGNRIRVANPWTGERVRVKAGEKELLVTDSNEIVCGTLANEVYVIERVKKPLSDMRFVGITAEKNMDIKTLDMEYIPRSTREGTRHPYQYRNEINSTCSRVLGIKRKED